MWETGAYRLLSGLVALAIAVVAAAAFLVATHMVEPGQINAGVAAFEEWLAAVRDAPFATRFGFALGAPVVGLLSLFVMLRAFGATRRTGMAMHILDSDDRGFVVVDSRGIAIVAEEAAHSAHGVVSAEVNVVPRAAKQVKLRVDVDVYPGANVKRAGSEARERVRSAVEELVGVEVTGITASTHVLEPEEMARALM